MHRDRDGTGVEAAEEAGDEVQAGRAQHQHPFPGGSLSLQVRGDLAGTPVEFPVGRPTGLVLVAVTGEAERRGIAPLLGTLHQQVHQRAEGVHRVVRPAHRSRLPYG